MVIGNAMTASAVALNRLGDEMHDSRARIEATLALGATAREAATPIVRRALRSGMITLIDSTKTTGLIFFPGTMVGMLLAGADPTDAVRLQLILLYVLLGASRSPRCRIALAYRNFFTPAHQLREPPASASGTGCPAPEPPAVCEGPSGTPSRPPIGCFQCPPPIIFSGIQPTGRKHLGNYIGAIRQYVEGQDRGEPAIFCIVDLHAISVAYDPADLRERVLRHGRDPARRRPRPGALHPLPPVRRREHTELTWLLSAVTAHGDLNRMHQFKEKSAKQRELASAALFYYPVLMAADVLAYRANEVPVGDDQRQHVELMRDIARRFNARFGEILVVPEHRYPRGRRADHGPAGAGAEDVDDRRHRGRDGLRPRRARRDPQEVRLRRHRLRPRGAPRRRQAGHHQPDRHPRRRPGVAQAEIEREFDGAGYGDFKEAVAEAVVELLAPVRERYAELRPDQAALEATLAAGAEKARAIASPTLADVRERMGFGVAPK